MPAAPLLSRVAARVGLSLCTLCAAAPDGRAQTLSELLGRGVRERVDGALAVLGVAAVPSETASTLLLDTGSPSDERYDFRGAQLGAGFTVSDAVPLYLEGFIAWNRYDPVFLLGDSGQQSVLPAKWTSVSATGGVGWDFPLTDHLTLRPIFNVSLGRVQSDISIAAQLVAERLGLDAEFLRDGGVTAGGLGGSLMLEYNRRWPNDVEADLTLRHTYIRLEPIAGDRDVAGRADAATTGLWSRLRLPTGARLFDRPVRLVGELSGSHLGGDQGAVLRADWLAQVGGGLEIDLSETPLPWVTTTRLVARYTFGERLEGFSIGLAASF